MVKNNLSTLLETSSQESLERMAISREPLKEVPKELDYAERQVNIWLVDEKSPDIDIQKLIQKLHLFQCSCAFFTDPNDIPKKATNNRLTLLLIKIKEPLINKSSSELQTISAAIHKSGCPVFIIAPDDDFQARLVATRLGVQDYYTDSTDTTLLCSQISDVIEHRAPAEMRVLIISDNTILSEKYSTTLKSAGIKATILNSPELIENSLLMFQPELVLVQSQVKSYSGIDIVKVIRQYNLWKRLPIIYLSPHTETTQKNQTIATGVDSILFEPISGIDLIATLYDRILLSRRLNSAITKDSLTGLLNQSSIKEAANTTMDRIRRTQGTATYAMLDIDNFKSINDNYGHSSGDTVLTALGMLLKNRLRRTDAVGRYGGDEFLVILSNCDGDNAYRVLNEIRQLFCNIPFHYMESNFHCTLSIGLSCSANHYNCDSSGLIEIADKALYTAKQSGRNQVAQLTDNNLPTA